PGIAAQHSGWARATRSPAPLAPAAIFTTCRQHGRAAAMTTPRQQQRTAGKSRGAPQAAPRFTQEMIVLYDEYTHLTLDRRRFFDHLTRVAGGTAAAYALLPLLENSYA